MTTWSAPGRVNLIGEHVDYNGGRVLPFAVDRRTEVTLTRRADDRVMVTSPGLGTTEISRLRPLGDSGWARYVAGALWSFIEETRRGLGGLDIGIVSTLPVGAGLSSSAAIECGVLAALDDHAGTSLGRREIAGLALRAEREYVGVPCGPMDQFAVMLAEPGHALLLDSDTLEAEQVPVPLSSAELTLLVIDTRVSHALGDGAYGERRRACAAAAEELGVGSLAEATVEQVLALPDPVMRQRAHHVVTEIRRVEQVVALLRAGQADDIGALLTASHQSLTDDFEVSCPELDTAVGAALAAGALGARMTGAGFGGSAIALCRTPESEAVEERIHQDFGAAGFRAPEVWPVSPAGGTHRSAR